MAEDVKGIMLFSEHLQGYDMLTDEQFGRLVRALFADCGLRKMPQLDATTQLVFQLVSPATRQAIAKWQNRDKANQENGKKGGRPPKNPNGKPNEPKKPMGLDEKPMGLDNETEKTDGVNHIIPEQSNVTNDLKMSNDISSGSDEQDERDDQDASKKCPQSEILALYKELLPELPQVAKLRENIQKSVRARWHEKRRDGKFATKDEGIAYFRRLFTYVQGNDFLMGRAGKSGWRCDYHWIMKADNFDKITSGYYSRGTI